jgi:hypothetical protein
MGSLWLIFLFSAAVVAAGVALIHRRRRRWAATVEQALAAFHIQREHQEARFLELAARRGRPAGWAWVDGEFDDRVVLACKRGTASLRALVQMTIVLEKITPFEEHGEGQQTRVQSATGVFLLSGNRWTTEGHTVLDLDPEETVDRFSGELERIA